jgi:hypothetical protein
MGFYDYRCMITGVSLLGADTALVLLQRTTAGHQPISLAIKGNYDRFGAIDGIDQDANTDLVLQYFHDKFERGEFVLNQVFLKNVDDYFEDIEGLLKVFERCVTEWDQLANLNGQTIQYALICREVWDAIVRPATPPRESDASLFQSLFQNSPVAKDIYSDSLPEVSVPLKELAAIQDFMTSRSLTWQIPEDAHQHWEEEIQEYLDEARQTFHDAPSVLAGLDAYEEAIADLLEEEDD